MFEGGEADHVTDELVMQPSDYSNGAFAAIGEDGEIKLTLTNANQDVADKGISRDAVTRIPGVFTITYTGDEYARVWLTDGVADVTFVGGADATEPLEGRENAVVIGPDQTVVVGLVVDTRGDHDVRSAREFTVHAEVADGETPAPSGGGEEQTSTELTTPDATLTEETPDGDVPMATTESAEEPPAESTTSDRTDARSPATDPGSDARPTDDGPLTVPPRTTDEGPIEVAGAGGDTSLGPGSLAGNVAGGMVALGLLLLLGLWRWIRLA